jgi:nucleoside-triphosphatase THEP1
VHGEPGIGKTTLVARFAKALRNAGYAFERANPLQTKEWAILGSNQ